MRARHMDDATKYFYKAMPAIALVYWIDDNPSGDIDQYLSQQINHLTEEYRSGNNHHGLRAQIATLHSLKTHLSGLTCDSSQSVTGGKPRVMGLDHTKDVTYSPP
jgi:hypothetical protein